MVSGRAGSRRSGRRARVLAGVEFLKSIGAVDIEYGRRVGGLLVDLFATIPPGKAAVIVCGPMSGDRLTMITSEVDVVYWIPAMPFMLQLTSRDMDRFYSGTGFVRCKKCGWEWEPEVEDPAICPHCKSSGWKEEEVIDVDDQTTPASKD